MSTGFIGLCPMYSSMETRVGLKILQMLLNEGLNNAGKKKLFVLEKQPKEMSINVN
jgi:hypothetical protein